MKESKSINTLFPVFLKLEEMRVLIVGGGKVGLEKLTAILSNSPKTKIKLVAATISNDIKKLAQSFPNISLAERTFKNDDVKNANVIIIAINDAAESKRIRAVAKQKKKLVNVADKPGQCDFYMSSIVQKGNLKIAISTNGKSPTIAKRLKELFQELLPDEIDSVLNQMQVIRARLQGDFAAKVETLNALTKELSNKEK